MCIRDRLYLDPLLKRVRDHTVAGLGRGRVFPGSKPPPFTLLVDFKTNGAGIDKRAFGQRDEAFI